MWTAGAHSLLTKRITRGYHRSVFLLLVVALFSGVTACDSDGTGAQVPLPLVDILCVGGKCSIAGTRDVVTNLTLSGCDPQQIDFEPVATGTGTVSCNGSRCTGTVSQWSASTVEGRSYYVCGWIDINDNAIKNAQMLFRELSIVSGAAITMNT